MKSVSESHISTCHFHTSTLNQRLQKSHVFKFAEQIFGFVTREGPSNSFTLFLNCISKPAFICSNNIQNLTVKSIPYFFIRFQIENLLVFLCFFSKDTDIDQISKMCILIAIIFNVIFECVRKLSTIVILLQRGEYEILVTLIDVFRTPTSFPIDKIDHNIQHKLS